MVSSSGFQISAFKSDAFISLYWCYLCSCISNLYFETTTKIYYVEMEVDAFKGNGHVYVLFRNGNWCIKGSRPLRYMSDRHECRVMVMEMEYLMLHIYYMRTVVVRLLPAETVNKIYTLQICNLYIFWVKNTVDHCCCFSRSRRYCTRRRSGPGPARGRVAEFLGLAHRDGEKKPFSCSGG